MYVAIFVPSRLLDTVYVFGFSVGRRINGVNKKTIHFDFVHYFLPLYIDSRPVSERTRPDCDACNEKHKRLYDRRQYATRATLNPDRFRFVFSSRRRFFKIQFLNEPVARAAIVLRPIRFFDVPPAESNDNAWFIQRMVCSYMH